MSFNKYLKGNGLDVSKKPTAKKFNTDCRYFFIEPNNLYSLRKFCDFESLDFIYSRNLINNSKFYRILIKEWFYFCKKGGYIVIETKPNFILNKEKLISECKLLLKDKIKLIDESENENIRIILKKTKPALRKNDSIDKWSFGILSNGKRPEEVEKEIQSIIDLKIPNFEIIICGDYHPKEHKNVRHIPFEPRVAWITKKKNIIAENAKYENLVITHDRFFFDKDWFNGMKKYGNYFEAMVCALKNPDGKRVDDWITFGNPLDDLDNPNLALLDYHDWDKNGFISGGFYILKKFVWEECKWNEALVWGQAEDADLSKQFYDKGVVARINPFSVCYTHTQRGNWVQFKINKYRPYTLKDRPFVNLLKQYVKMFCRKHIVR